MDRVDVLGVAFDNLNMDEAVSEALRLIETRSCGYVVTPNPEIVIQADENPALLAAISDASLVLADGIGVVKGASILGRPLKDRVPGCDFAAALMEKLAQSGGSVYFFGAKPGVAEKAAEKLAERFPGMKIAGTRDGYFTDDSAIIEDINAAAPDFLMVCLGAPKQELWMQKNAGLLRVGLMAGLGGSLDVFAGEVKRAPVGWQKLGLEWLYRALSDPKRIVRMKNLPVFVLRTVRQRLKGQKNGR